MLETIKAKLRAYWLVAKRDLKDLSTRCEACGSFNAYPCSLANCRNLCINCQRFVNDEVDRLFKIGKYRGSYE